MTPHVFLFALSFVVSLQFTHVVLAQPEDSRSVYINYSRLYLDHFDTSFEAVDLSVTVLEGGYNFNIRIFPEVDMEIQRKTFNLYSTYFTLGFGVFINDPFPKLTSDAEFQLAIRPPDYDEWEEAEKVRHERRLWESRREWDSAHEIMLDRPLSVDMIYIDIEGCAYYASSVELQYVQLASGDWCEWDLQVSSSEGSRFSFPWKRVELLRAPQFDENTSNNT